MSFTIELSYLFNSLQIALHFLGNKVKFLNMANKTIYNGLYLPSSPKHPVLPKPLAPDPPRRPKHYVLSHQMRCSSPILSLDILLNAGKISLHPKQVSQIWHPLKTTLRCPSETKNSPLAPTVFGNSLFAQHTWSTDPPYHSWGDLYFWIDINNLKTKIKLLSFSFLFDWP